MQPFGFIRKSVHVLHMRAKLWKAALGEEPGETPGPAGRALLADLRKLWLTREED